MGKANYKSRCCFENSHQPDVFNDTGLGLVLEGHLPDAKLNVVEAVCKRLSTNMETRQE